MRDFGNVRPLNTQSLLKRQDYCVSGIGDCKINLEKNPIMVAVKVGRLSADYVHDVWDTDNRRIVESPPEAIRRLFDVLAFLLTSRRTAAEDHRSVKIIVSRNRPIIALDNK
jgi:hypothetical protein